MATIETLKIAKKLGNKVVIIGQSTGGLIASIIAAYYPELIDAIIIIEPALKVNSIKTGAPASVVKYLKI